MNEEEQLKSIGISNIDVNKELYDSVRLLYMGIAKVDIKDNNAVILQSSIPDEIKNVYLWDEYLKCYADRFVMPTDHARVFDNFNIEGLKKNISKGKQFYSCDLSAMKERSIDGHITMLAFCPEKDYVYVMVRDAGGDYLLKSIVTNYVYNTCDYFIYLDANNNSYNMFSGVKGTPLPPQHCMDYEAAMIEYIRHNVAQEDQDMVIREMKLSRIIEQLDKCGVHSFTCGEMEDVRGYTRKRLTYRYQDEEKKMILMSRTDVTDIYMEEQHKQNELEKALLRAQTDPLTKLWNHQATIDKITKCIEKNKAQYALFFIDLDNFKKINDTLGHPVGDKVLQGVADILKNSADEGDIVGRIGGDEFIVFAKCSNNGKDSVQKHAERIGRGIRELSHTDIAKGMITGSIGISLFPQDGGDYNTLVEKADTGLYNAKATGKDTYCF